MATKKGRAAHAANNKKESNFIDQLSRESGLTLLSDKESRRLPYLSGGGGHKGDAIWIPPIPCRWKGIVVEVQGMGRHSRFVGMSDDCKKACIAQLGGWLWFPITYRKESVAPMARRLAQMSVMILDSAQTPASPETQDEEFITEDCF